MRITGAYQLALREDLLEKGFSLEEEADHFLYLTYKGARVATFPQTGHISLEEIHAIADKWWNDMIGMPKAEDCKT